MSRSATASKSSKGLGKGLSALMSDHYTSSVAPVPPAPAHRGMAASEAVPLGTPVAASEEGGITRLPIAALQAGVYQPRRHFSEEALEELALSISQHGLMQPLVVRAVGDGRYEIIAGERRFRASQRANLTEIPAIIRNVSDAEALELALIENIQRRDLNPLEEAAGYQRLIEEFRYTQEKLASMVGKSRSHVANLLRLLALPEKIKTMVDSGALTMGHARALLSANDPEELAQRIVAVGMSVREAEEYLQLERVPTAAPKKPPRVGAPRPPVQQEKSEDVLQLEQMLSDNLGLPVTLTTHSNSAGSVTIAYANLQQLDEVLRRLGSA